MCYAEKTFGRSPLGKLEMDIGETKVQLTLGRSKGVLKVHLVMNFGIKRYKKGEKKILVIQVLM